MYIYIYTYIYPRQTKCSNIIYTYVIYIYIYIYISYTYRHIVNVTCLTSKRRSSIGQTIIKTKQSEVDGKIYQNMKRPFLPQCLNATKHLGEIRLHMVSKLFC